MSAATLVVTGANGFIGRHLIETLCQPGKPGHVKALVRSQPHQALAESGAEVIQGDIGDARVWRVLAEPGCTVINLAYSFSAGPEAVLPTARMIDACADIGIRRFVHCSTVSIYGRLLQEQVTEVSPCRPWNEYGRTKLAIERELVERVRSRFEVVIVRPSAVFGSGGKALTKLAHNLMWGNKWLNYARSSLFGRRRTHLVPVETVAAAILFLSSHEHSLDLESFIVSDDESPLNNFRDVERVLMEELGVPLYPVAQMPLPRSLLETALRARGQANINSRTVYCCDKLLELGFRKPVTLESALRRFAKLYKSSHACVVPHA